MGLVFCLLVILAAFVGYFKWKQSYWQRRGVPGPRGIPFLGSFYEIADKENPRVFVLHEWTKKFGKVFGFYEGVIPVMVVSDPEMLQELFVRKFNHFYARKSTNSIHGNLECPKEEPRVNLFSSRGARWKRLRALASPVFSVKAMRQIHETVDNSVLCMMDHLAKHENNSAFNIHLYFQELTYDIICRLAMGQPYSEQFNNEGVEIVKNIFLRSNRVLPWYLTVMFPNFQNSIKNVFFNHEAVRGGDIGKLLRHCEAAVNDRIKEREENKQLGIENTQNDFIDMFLDHYTESEIEDSQFGTPFERKVNSQDVIGACFVFLLAGFDTTANTLAYASYLLAKNPEKMQMVQEEVDRTCDSDIISYDDLTRMNYLDAVIREALRLYPVAWFACSRECVSTTTLGEYVIEKGVRVEADLMALHRSKEIWGENADDFVPERWFVETRRPSMSWIPFGAGPRQCVGMRLGLCETKTAFAHILRKYSIVAGPETEDKLRILGCTTNCPESVTVYLESRYPNFQTPVSHNAL